MTTPTSHPQRADSRLVFISYARADQEAADRIRQAIVAMHHEAWIDSTLEGGHEWWDEILRQLRLCDAVIAVVSMDLLSSEAATAERDYAQALGKPLIPIKVATVRDELLPPDIATRQYIDFMQPTLSTGIELANVLRDLPDAANEPTELPSAPPIPRSYLSGISELLYRPTLNDEEQRAIAWKLGDALQRPRERDTALELLGILENRRDLYASTEREIVRIRRELTSDRQPSVAEPARGSAGPTEPVFQSRRPPQAASSAPPTEEQTARISRPAMRPSSPQGSPNAPIPAQHWALSITGMLISLVGLLPVGVVAVVMSSQVASRWNRGDFAGSVKASRQAIVWGWVGIGWGVIITLAYFFAAYSASYYGY